MLAKMLQGLFHSIQRFFWLLFVGRYKPKHILEKHLDPAEAGLIVKKQNLEKLRQHLAVAREEQSKAQRQQRHVEQKMKESEDRVAYLHEDKRKVNIRARAEKIILRKLSWALRAQCEQDAVRPRTARSYRLDDPLCVFIAEQGNQSLMTLIGASSYAMTLVQSVGLQQMFVDIMSVVTNDRSSFLKKAWELAERGVTALESASKVS